MPVYVKSQILLLSRKKNSINMILLYLRTIPAVKISVSISWGLYLFHGKVKKKVNDAK